MSDIYDKHRLSDGRTVWIQRVKCPGVRKPQWSVVVCSAEWMAAPEIVNVSDHKAGLAVLADLLRDDVLEVA